MIEAGEASAVYSYSLSRLSRSLRDFAALVELATAHGVPIRLAKDTMNLGTASGRFSVNVLASAAAFEAELAQERARDTLVSRRAAGKPIGSAGYGFRMVKGEGRLEPVQSEPIGQLVDAHREARTFAGAARLLNERGIPARRGGKWSGTALARILGRALPETRQRGKPGRRRRTDFTLSRLLLCPCGNVMTGRTTSHTTPYGSYGPYVSYQCFRGRYEPDHPRPYMISEAVLMPWVREQAARLAIPHDREASPGPDPDVERRAADETFRRVSRAYAAGGLDDDEYEEARLKHEAELDSLADLPTFVEVPAAVDWSWAPELLNPVLRALWRRIELGPDLRPVRAEPLVPEWWAA